MRPVRPGERVFAIRDANNEEVHLYGFGAYTKLRNERTEVTVPVG